MEAWVLFTNVVLCIGERIQYKLCAYRECIRIFLRESQQITTEPESTRSVKLSAMQTYSCQVEFRKEQELSTFNQHRIHSDIQYFKLELNGINLILYEKWYCQCVHMPCHVYSHLQQKLRVCNRFGNQFVTPRVLQLELQNEKD